MDWPEQFYAWRAGDGCPACQEGRPEAILEMEVPRSQLYFEDFSFMRGR